MMEKQKKSTMKKQQNIHETIYGSVPVTANKTAVKPSNKRPREEQTPQPHLSSKQVPSHTPMLAYHQKHCSSQGFLSGLRSFCPDFFHV
jgi:hypothetical protein